MPLNWRIVPSVTIDVRPGELRPLMGAATLFFLVLAALMVLRPARESLGLSGGIEAVRWMFTIAMAAMLVVNPAFAWLVARFPRTVFVPATYAILSVNLLGFLVFARLSPDAVGPVSGRVFYVWTSVVNFLAVSVFWALIADRFTPEASRRLFGAVAVGGTLGAIAGSAVAMTLATRLGTLSTLAVGAALLTAAAVTAAIVARGGRVGKPIAASAGDDRDDGAQRVIGGSSWRGFVDTVRSPYLLGICVFIMLTAVVATFLYFAELSIVAASAVDLDERTGIFARVNLWTQVATLVLQAFIAGHVMRRLGVGVALAMLPAVAMLGLGALAIAPTLWVIVIVQAGFKAIQRAIVRPARETLFTVVTPEERYKAKVLIDTFVYRTGDVVGAQVERPLNALAPGFVGVLAAVLPVSVAWIGLSLWLGERQRRRAIAIESPLVTPSSGDADARRAASTEFHHV